MATALPTTYSTLADWAKLQDPDGSIAQVAELLSQMNQIIEDMPFIEGNLPTGHRGSVRTSLPTPTWRRINQGIDPAKSTSAQVTDVCGMQEALAIVDVALADLNGNSAAWRLQENKAFIEGMTQDMAGQIMYGNSATSPEKMMGFTPRYNTLTTGTSQTANNVVNGGSSASSTSTSIWLVGWSPDKVTGIFPKGSKAGLQDQDLGEDWAFDPNSKRYRAYMTRYVWKAGLHVRDWRYVVRVANLETGSGTAGFTSSAPVDIVDCLDQAIAKIPNLSACRPVLYMNRKAKRYLNKQRNYGVAASSTVNLTTIRRADSGSQRGVIQRFEDYDGIPIKIVDQILNTESTIS
jgi:hypothetical protein